MPLSRRKFLQGVSLMAGAVLLSDPAQLLAGAESGQQFLIVGSEKSVCRVDLTTGRVQAVPVGFSAHSFLQHPHDPARFLATEKWGPHAAMVDFKKEQATQILPPADHNFYGHASFTAAGDKIFISSVSQADGKGYLAGYDSETLAPAARFKVAPGRLHEFVFLSPDLVLVASMGIRAIHRDISGPKVLSGKRVEISSLIQVDLQNGEVRHRADLPTDKESVSHFRITRSGTVIAMGLPWPKDPHHPGAFYFSPALGAPLQKIELGPAAPPGASQGEMLSIAVDETRQIAAVTNPNNSAVVFVDTRNGKYLGGVQQWATGVVYDSALEKFLLNGHEGLFTLDETGKRHQASPILTAANQAQPIFDSPHSLIV